MGGCQNYGHFLGTLNNRCRIIVGTQKGTIILTTTQVSNADITQTKDASHCPVVNSWPDKAGIGFRSLGV